MALTIIVLLFQNYARNRSADRINFSSLRTPPRANAQNIIEIGNKKNPTPMFPAPKNCPTVVRCVLAEEYNHIANKIIATISTQISKS